MFSPLESFAGEEQADRFTFRSEGLLSLFIR